jgi:hypothetical protein
MFITPLLEVAKFLAEACTFARDICKPKSPVKAVFLPTTLELLQRASGKDAAESKSGTA